MDKRKLYVAAKQKIIDFAVLFIILSGLENIFLSFPHRFGFVQSLGLNYSLFNPETIAIHRAMSTVVGIIMIFVCYRLYKRMRMAWFITILILPLSLALRILRYHDIVNAFSIAELSVIFILLFFYKDFHKTSDPINFKWGLSIAVISLILVLMNTALGLLYFRHHFKNIYDFTDAFMKSLQLLFYMDISIIEPKTRLAYFIGRSSIILNWTSITAAIFLILKPLIYQPFISKLDREKVREYLNSYSDNPISYVAIEEDKKYFFSNSVDGAIAYVIAGGVAVCAGDPICKEEDAAIFLVEFVTFCRQNDLDICFCQTTEKYLNYYKSLNFGILKYGEEAMFDLQQYNISGGKAAKVRQAINNANREGIKVIEYKPLNKRNRELESQILEVSKEWLSIKKSSELSFMLGSVSLDNPMERRYFVALDENEKVLGFTVFTPFSNKTGYYADVTRRRKEAPMGVMEKLIISAFEAMKAEGLLWGSLGLAPLANIKDEDSKKTMIDTLLEFIYENLNNFYGFKTLHQYKKKYNPSSWQPRYLVYYPKLFTPKVAYSIIKAQNPKGVTDFILTQIKQIFINNKEQ